MTDKDSVVGLLIDLGIHFEVMDIEYWRQYPWVNTYPPMEIVITTYEGEKNAGYSGFECVF